MCSIPSNFSGAPVIIVAEDEPLIRMMISEILSDEGFEILEARHAEEALAILRDRANDVAMLFTDIQMPGEMDGLELVRRARGQWPWIALLVTSGKARPMARDMPDGSRFISKPYDPDHVVRQVRELVAAA